MEFKKIQEIELPAAFDAHVHLRDGEMSQLVTPTIRKGGVNTVYVMVSLNCRFSLHARYDLRASSSRCSLLSVISDIYCLFLCSIPSQTSSVQTRNCWNRDMKV